MASWSGSLVTPAYSGGAVPDLHRCSLFVERPSVGARPPTHVERFSLAGPSEKATPTRAVWADFATTATVRGYSPFDRPRGFDPCGRVIGGDCAGDGQGVASRRLVVYGRVIVWGRGCERERIIGCGQVNRRWLDPGVFGTRGKGMETRETGKLMSDVIRIKPHHFIDILAALGRGQRTFEAHPYGHAVHSVAAVLLEQPEALLEIELGADDVCRPCKHNVDGRCDDTIDTSFRPDAPRSKREYNLLIDRRWCERLGLQPGERIGARQFCRRLGELRGDLTAIYRETPVDRTAERERAIRAGVEAFLAMEAS